MYPNPNYMHQSAPSTSPYGNWTGQQLSSSSQRTTVATSNNSASEALSTMNVRILDEYKLQAPIAVPAALLPSTSETSQGLVPLDTGMERQLIEPASTSHVENFLKGSQPGALEDARVKKYMDMGYKRSEASLGLAYVQHANLREAEAVEFITNFRQLVASMGYSPSLAAGALMRNNNKLEAAVEDVLNASGLF
ncbi:hypothetical protein CEUSTIGMA_g950.t1 [Chlamydomonas eustigma]|uniref:UBA domain-containing protein n=1 Tax=Chlamydomonas eustigma TaxID=1157962 RepID=A0A250WRP1_9CHLO|nr:hypothetical protein CEUSTIGMA_g950.t1 [Chlamydomonas eustigma]|eukprot:GAX73498.1 hypothetical protein CEUSTIGMA_g950.t1 [Chlamydomonas eustigma]